MYSEIIELLEEKNIVLDSLERDILNALRERADLIASLADYKVKYAQAQDKIDYIDKLFSINFSKKDHKKYARKYKKLKLIINDIDNKIIEIRNPYSNIISSWSYKANHHKDTLKINFGNSLKFRYISPKLTIKALNPTTKYLLVTNTVFVLAFINANIIYDGFDPLFINICLSLAAGLLSSIGGRTIYCREDDKGEKYNDLDWLINARNMAKDKLNESNPKDLKDKNIDLNKLLKQKKEILDDISSLKDKIEKLEQEKKKYDTIIDIEIEQLDPDSELKKIINSQEEIPGYKAFDNKEEKLPDNKELPNKKIK